MGVSSRDGQRLATAFYSASVPDFLAHSDAEILGTLTQRSPFAVEVSDRNAWLEEISVLRRALAGIDGALLLEYDVPRLGSRIDAVVLSGAAVISLEFKCGAREYERVAVNQAWDYALDLKNFHSASHAADLFPILVATRARASEAYWTRADSDGVRRPLRSNGTDLGAAIRVAISQASGPDVDVRAWMASAYQPSPTIIEAARALYARHSVEAISRSDAGSKHLRETSKCLESIIRDSRARGQKSLVFVTGVPGAGKTLVGLNIATQHRRSDEPTHAVFLSGNQPLVAVLQEALTRDEWERLKARGEPRRKGEVRQSVKPFIQNVHHFRDAGLRDRERPPADRVVIFDEAQRAWNRQKTSDFMRRKKKIAGFDESEPEFLISYMDRHADWAVVVCLVGGGQEIHTGEAGISAWIEAARARFPAWNLFISPQLTDREYAAGRALERLDGRTNLRFDQSLHLSVSMRSFRAEHLSSFVKAVLDRDQEKARSTLASVARRYPIAVTRSLQAAKRWVRERARGSERVGIVASSQAQRLKPHAVDVRVSVNPIHWFLGAANDTRSSCFLEDAATEFQVQGLELDWTVVTWDADLRMTQHGWSHHDFHGKGWRRIGQDVRQQYLENAYRVLLTRARQGLVIFVPAGDPGDATRAPAYYDGTFEYLVSVGIPELTS
jgi:hypothetical protein